MSQHPSLIRVTEGIIGYYVVLEATVTTNDTVKVRQLSLINGVVALKMADWSAVSCTWTGNIITVTQSGLINARIVVVAGGQK